MDLCSNISTLQVYSKFNKVVILISFPFSWGVVSRCEQSVCQTLCWNLYLRGDNNPAKCGGANFFVTLLWFQIRGTHINPFGGRFYISICNITVWYLVLIISIWVVSLVWRRWQCVCRSDCKPKFTYALGSRILPMWWLLTFQTEHFSTIAFWWLSIIWTLELFKNSWWTYMGFFDWAFVSTYCQICWIKPDNWHLGRKRGIRASLIAGFL